MRLDVETWIPIYHAIAKDLGIDPEKDAKVAKALSKMILENDNILPREEVLEEVSRLISKKKVFVFGSGPDLEEELDRFTTERLSALSSDDTSIFDAVLISADGATSALLSRDMLPHIIVTDLDGVIPDQVECLGRGCIMLLHGHADNMETLVSTVPNLTGKVLGTTQVSPYEGGMLDNFGGFTDGDRAVFLAEHFGASSIILLGFNFNEVGEKIGPGGVRSDMTAEQLDRKFRKLTWASVLLGLVTSPQPVSYSERDVILRQVFGGGGGLRRDRPGRDH